MIEADPLAGKEVARWTRRHRLIYIDADEATHEKQAKTRCAS